MKKEEAIKILKEMRQELQEEVNQTEDWVNTGVEEEQVQALDIALHCIETCEVLYNTCGAGTKENK